MTAVYSEAEVFIFLRDKLKLDEVDARKAVADIATSHEKLQGNVTETIDTRFRDLKEVFMTKDDKNSLLEQMGTDKISLIREINDVKIELIKYVDAKFTRQTTIIIAAMGIFLTIFMYIMKH